MKTLKAILFISIMYVTVSCTGEDLMGALLEKGDRIPDFNVTMNTGEKIDGESLRDGISLIAFFHTSCPDCQATLPQIQMIYDEYAGNNVKFALISREEGEKSIADFWKAEGLTMPYSAQKDRKIYELFANSGIPRVYICQNGLIMTVFTDDPRPTYGDLKSALDTIIN